MIPAKLDVLIVSEDFSEDGNDRSTVVARAISYALEGYLRVDANLSGRENLTPERVGEIVAASGCLVVLCDAHDFASGGEKTPKTRAALRALAPDQLWCYVLPLSEQAAAEDEKAGHPGRCKLVEEAAVMLAEHFAKRFALASDAASPSATT